MQNDEQQHAAQGEEHTTQPFRYAQRDKGAGSDRHDALERDLVHGIGAEDPQLDAGEPLPYWRNATNHYVRHPLSRWLAVAPEQTGKRHLARVYEAFELARAKLTEGRHAGFE